MDWKKADLTVHKYMSKSDIIKLIDSQENFLIKKVDQPEFVYSIDTINVDLGDDALFLLNNRWWSTKNLVEDFLYSDSLSGEFKPFEITKG